MKHKKVKYIKYCFGIRFVNDVNKSSHLLSEMDIQLSKGSSIFGNNWIVERRHDSLIDNTNNDVCAFINSLIINYFYV